MDEATRLMAGKEYEIVSMEVFSLVRKSKCSAYDCEFVALPKKLRVPFVTLDKQTLYEFPEIAISPEQFTVQRSPAY